jgi:hypothetical protein
VDLIIKLFLDKIQEYQRNLHNTDKIPRNRLPRILKKKPYIQTGRRNQGRPLKRFLYVSDRNGSTICPAPCWIDDDNDGDTSGRLKAVIAVDLRWKGSGFVINFAIYSHYVNNKEGRDSSVGIGTGYGLDGPRIESR